MTGLLAALCGVGAYVVFLVIILYAIGFFGQPYRRYRQHVAMLLAWPGRKPNEPADAHASAPEPSAR